MEEDIKVLEETIKSIDFNNKEQVFVLGINQIELIQNLINRNKELEEKANRLGKLYYEVNENCIKYEKDYIPKSKVKEKIEELEAISISEDIYYEDILKMFQELLQEGDK